MISLLYFKTIRRKRGTLRINKPIRQVGAERWRSVLWQRQPDDKMAWGIFDNLWCYPEV
ncbi:MAG: hypothetical protein HND48_03315 [Chloroflexi bacterium]|nr:hypothetical protein [Chloroflexota bacterium]